MAGDVRSDDAGEVRAAVLELAEEAAAGRLSNDGAEELALGLARLHGRPAVRPDQDELDALMRELTGRLDPQASSRMVGALWVKATTGGDEDDFYWSCILRSGLQLLLDAGLGPLLDEPMLGEADDSLRSMAGHLDPVPEDDIPPLLPESHWWWRAPRSGNPGPVWEQKGPQHVVNRDGIEVFSWDRFHVGYRNGGNEWKVAVERGPTYTVFADSLETVKGGHDLVGDARAAVVETIADGLRAMRDGPVVVE